MQLNRDGISYLLADNRLDLLNDMTVARLLSRQVVLMNRRHLPLPAPLPEEYDDDEE